MFNDSFLVLLSSLTNISTALNAVAACFLFVALITPLMETIKTKKTFFLPVQFYVGYVAGAFFLLINAIAGIIGGHNTPLFCVFLVVNIVGLLANGYMYTVKMQNVNAAKSKGISEQEYWETVIKPTLENQQ
ncbi:conserved hypothetical protein [Mycoplasma haemofelis str. Langford 1]|uniref:Uncharacterized protein n=1 Tax=Mycoplasma haemofelis (strain Langford 1) TaxID=941640 RepID=E8ZJ16_MYCHL|nr:hypothetical protein [Mycoplasma haemofelis]CBY93137.1 conserved hypothetical protein [Mycoplasma haemofelis str. Langford 1]